MAGEDDGGSPRLCLGYLRLQEDDALDIQGVDWLVKYDQIRVPEKGAGMRLGRRGKGSFFCSELRHFVQNIDVIGFP